MLDWARVAPILAATLSLLAMAGLVVLLVLRGGATFNSSQVVGLLTAIAALGGVVSTAASQVRVIDTQHQLISGQAQIADAQQAQDVKINGHLADPNPHPPAAA